MNGEQEQEGTETYLRSWDVGLENQVEEKDEDATDGRKTGNLINEN